MGHPHEVNSATMSCDVITAVSDLVRSRGFEVQQPVSLRSATVQPETA